MKLFPGKGKKSQTKLAIMGGMFFALHAKKQGCTAETPHLS